MGDSKRTIFWLKSFNNKISALEWCKTFWVLKSIWGTLFFTFLLHKINYYSIYFIWLITKFRFNKIRDAFCRNRIQKHYYLFYLKIWAVSLKLKHFDQNYPVMSKNNSKLSSFKRFSYFFPILYYLRVLEGV